MVLLVIRLYKVKTLQTEEHWRDIEIKTMWEKVSEIEEIFSPKFECEISSANLMHLKAHNSMQGLGFFSSFFSVFSHNLDKRWSLNLHSYVILCMHMLGYMNWECLALTITESVYSAFEGISRKQILPKVLVVQTLWGKHASTVAISAKPLD